FRDSNGQIGLIDRYCAHRRADLFFGRNEDCGLRCVYHGWKYDVAGNCVDQPSEPPEFSFKDDIRLAAYPCQERGGLIWAYLGPPDFKAEMPELEWARVPATHRYMRKYFVECNYLQALEGDIDSTHVRYLHSMLSQHAASRAAGRQGDNRLPGSNNTLYAGASNKFHHISVKDTDYGLMYGFQRPTGDEEEDYSWHITHWLMPSYALIANGVPGQTLRCNVRVPMTDTSFMFFRVQWNPDRPLTAAEIEEYEHGISFEESIPGTFLPKRNKENDWLIDRELQKSWNFTGIRSIPEQDQAMTISMGPIADRTKEHLGSSDTAIHSMRQKLLRTARDLLEGTDPFAAAHGDVYRVRQLDILLKKDIDWVEGTKELIKARA
ncbi:MAG TPA: Rieske 2Fe-2S domain-containing protein, partial [Dehalococcoidia bacterium]|nr:Rieske 2Fe-2S domain-containing protein [Dehalococcoidia bacterium]